MGVDNIGNVSNDKVACGNCSKCAKCSQKSKLSICSLAFAVGLTNGIGMMVLAYMGMMHWIGDGMIVLISSMYHGYAPTVVGGLFGLGWGFLDGFLFGMLVAIFYNCCLCCCCCCCKKSKSQM
jgi:hypothetical protein